MSSKTRYYINMNDGRVIAGTEETKENIFYKEIDISYALAIRDGKITAKEVINRVNAKIGMIPFSDMMASVQKMNVRTKDLHMEEHAQGGDAAEDDSDGGESGVIGEFKDGEAKPVKKSKAAAAAEAALGTAVRPSDEAGESVGGLNI